MNPKEIALMILKKEKPEAHVSKGEYGEDPQEVSEEKDLTKPKSHVAMEKFISAVHDKNVEKACEAFDEFMILKED